MTRRPSHRAFPIFVMGLTIPLLVAILTLLLREGPSTDDPPPPLAEETIAVETSHGESSPDGINGKEGIDLDDPIPTTHVATATQETSIAESSSPATPELVASQEVAPQPIPTRPIPVLQLTLHPVLSGGQVNPVLEVQGQAHLSELEFNMGYPGDRVLLGSFNSVLEYPVMQIESQPRFGGQEIRLAFSEPVDVHFPKRLLQFRVKVSKRNEIGAVIPLTFLSARAVTSDGEEIQLQTEDGLIQIVESLDDPFDPEAIPTPSETPSGSSVAMDSGGLAVATPDAEFPSPTPRETPTPVPPILLYVFPTQAYPGTRARIPVVVSDAENLQGGQFEASFNTDLIQLRKVISGDAFSGFFAFGNPTSNGGMVALAGAQPTSYLGEATLCLLEVDISPNALPGTALRVDFSGVILASAAGEVPTRTQPGFLRIVSAGSEEFSENKAKPPLGIERNDIVDNGGKRHPNISKDRSLDGKGEEPLSVYDLNFDRQVDAYDLLLLLRFLNEQSEKTLFE